MAFTFGLPALAASIDCHGDHVEYTTFPSTIIPAQVADAHGIVRSKDRIVTNITVLRNGKALTATVDGTATGLMNEVTTLTFQEVREADAIYYLATLVATERDNISYRIKVQPDGRAPCVIEFTRDYYRAGPEQGR